jgi:peroxiredoxin
MVPRALVAVDVGKPAPGLVVPEVDGRTFDLSTLRGKVVIVNFWATWCAPCREEIPILEAFYRSHHGQGLEVIGLSMDRSREHEAVKKLMQSVSYPVALASDAKVNGFGAARALPVTYVVDETGTVRARLTPDTPLTEERLEDVVLPLLSTQDTTPAPPPPNAGRVEARAHTLWIHEVRYRPTSPDLKKEEERGQAPAPNPLI